MYKQMPLPFLYQDLEPYIDTHTIGLHYNKHQKNYLKNLNALLIKNNFDFTYPIEEVYNHLYDFNGKDLKDIIFNLGGVVNHNLYWESISPKNKEKLKGNLLDSINKKYGSFDEFKKTFIEYALKIKGSGYTFLVMNERKNIEIMNMQNQDSPYLFKFTPLFVVDLWEHAYYINYESYKQNYLDNFFEIANFAYANKIYNE